jgi:hypothetical protein
MSSGWGLVLERLKQLSNAFGSGATFQPAAKIIKVEFPDHHFFIRIDSKDFDERAHIQYRANCFSASSHKGDQRRIFLRALFFCIGAQLTRSARHKRIAQALLAFQISQRRFERGVNFGALFVRQSQTFQEEASPGSFYVSLEGGVLGTYLKIAIFPGEEIVNGGIAEFIVHAGVDEFPVGKDQLALVLSISEGDLGFVLFAALQLNQVGEAEVSKGSIKWHLNAHPFVAGFVIVLAERQRPPMF